nr:hypothetical protein GCM10017745_35540 [Saccharothrix mutabilis subsp. capreolus]
MTSDRPLADDDLRVGSRPVEDVPTERAQLLERFRLLDTSASAARYGRARRLIADIRQASRHG